MLALATTFVFSACDDVTDPPVPAALIIAAPSDTAIAVGGSFQARIEAFDELGNTLTGRIAQYRSLTPGVVTVSGSGVVTGAEQGFARVEALLADLRDTLEVTVLDPRIGARVPLSGGLFSAAVTPSGTAFLTRTESGTVTRLNLSTKQVAGSTFTGSVPTQVILNVGATTAYVSNQFSRTISVLSAATGMSTASFPTSGDPVGLAVRNASDFLYFTTNTNRVYRAALPSGTVLDSLQLTAMSHHLLMHPNNDLLYVSTRDGGSVLEVNALTMAVTRTFTTGGRTQAMAIAPDQSELYVANEHGWLNVINLGTGSIAATIPLGGGAFGMTLSPDGNTLFVGLPMVGQVQQVSRATRLVIGTIFTGGSPRGLAVHPASQTVVVTNEAGWVDLIPD